MSTITTAYCFFDPAETDLDFGDEHFGFWGMMVSSDIDARHNGFAEYPGDDIEGALAAIGCWEEAEAYYDVIEEAAAHLPGDKQAAVDVLNDALDAHGIANVRFALGN